MPDSSIHAIGGSLSGNNLIDGQCQQAWTNLSYQEKNANPSAAQCQVSYTSGFSYHYAYQLPQTNISYYTGSQSYDVPQTVITYFKQAQSYDVPQTSISYFSSHQEFDALYTNVSYYTAVQSYDLPATRVNYFTQQSAMTIDLQGDYSLVGCAAFVAGKLPAGALTDPFHIPSCTALPPQHIVGACDPADPSKSNCVSSYSKLSLSAPLKGDFQSAGCSAFVAGKLPMNSLLNDVAHPVACSAAASVHQSGACSVADATIANCQTVYAQSTLAPKSGDYSALGCSAYAAGKLPSAAILNDAQHPISCAAAANKHVVGACSVGDTSILNCSTTFPTSNLTVSGDFSSVGCDSFVVGKIPSGGLIGDANHPASCAAAAKPKHVVGACSPSDTSILNCVTNYTIASVNNVSGDFSTSGCSAFASGKIPAAAVLNDAAHPITCVAGTPLQRFIDGTQSFTNALWANYNPAVNDNCSAGLASFVAAAQSIPAPTSCKITALQSGSYTYNNSSCVDANPVVNYCGASSGAKRNCVGSDIAAGAPYAANFSTLKVPGAITCDTLCSATSFCSAQAGTVGDNYHSCSVQALANSIDHTFTGVDAAALNTCSAGQTLVVTNGPYQNKTASALQSNVPDSACVKVNVCVNPAAWKSLTPVKDIPSIDLVILFDVTSSMTPSIQAMIANLENLITNLNTLTPNLRLGLASYRDFADHGGQPGDLPFMMNVPLTADASQIKAGLSSLTASGGGDLPEALSTAIRATVDGNAMAPYFGASQMGWDNDPNRIKIVLGISDAADKKTGLPAGAATLDQVVNLLKAQGILFMGIGYQYQTEPYPGANTFTSYNDFAYLAQNTGAIVAAPGIDLDGDGKTTTYGELSPGAPAVLLMTPDGSLAGAPAGADPTRVLADAITKMVETTRPFQFNLSSDGSGRVFTPAVNNLSIPSEANGQFCFTQVAFNPKDVNAACGLSSPLTFSVTESSTNSVVDNSNYVASVNIDESCGASTNPPGTTPPTVAPPSPNPAAWAVQGFDGTTTASSATLIWQTPGMPTTATVHVGTRADQLDFQVLTVSNSAMTQILVVNGLAANTTYYFQVDTRDSNNNIVQSGVISKTTKP